jgi:molecular chaperone GrpE
MPSSPASEGNDHGVRGRAAGPWAENRPDEDGPEGGRGLGAASTPGNAGEAGDDERPPATELSELEGRYAQLEDRYKRALADLDNYRKRSAREVQRRVDESREALARDWLEAVDSVERALRMGEPENPMFEGLRGVLEQMEAVLDRQGVTRIGEAGERFDPEYHEAVGVAPSDDVPDHTVVEVARSGFALGDRVLRPAQVIVSRREPSQR